MPRKTSLDELYNELGALVERATGRRWWRRTGIQAQPKGTYALIHLADAEGAEKQIVTDEQLPVPADDGQLFVQYPWGTSRINVHVEFLRTRGEDTVLVAAGRLRQALYQEARFWDLWQIAALLGGVRITDLSTIFRADVEPRAEVRFALGANVADPLPLADSEIYDIMSQQVNVDHVNQAEEHDEVVVSVNGE